MGVARVVEHQRTAERVKMNKRKCKTCTDETEFNVRYEREMELVLQNKSKSLKFGQLDPHFITWEHLLENVLSRENLTASNLHFEII